ncbi:uncharacterized protein JCM15063_002042 [Sporobolomyces koalae]|uniref:uncharacterized protein n=1 Tax=Sporobolomyces koalae TaxID=500713 RepID=UPI00317286F7
MMRFTILSTATLALLGAVSVSAQSANTIETEMNTLVVNIPESCLGVCSPWQQAYQQCPVASDATTAYSQCTCAAAFVANYNACTGCMANVFNEVGDTTDAATATQAPTDLSNYCANAGLTEAVLTSTSTSTTDSVTSTTTTDAAAATTTTTSAATTATTSSSVSSSSSASTASGSVGGNPSPGEAFPSQTKSPSAFANSGVSVQGFRLELGVVAGLFMGMMLA